MARIRRVEFPPHDEALRADVNLLGRIVGDMLAEQRSPEFLDQVERIRREAIRRRERPDGDASALKRRLEHLSESAISDLARAFSTYFQVVNLAEKVHRIRRTRAHQAAGAAPQPGGLEALLAQLTQEGVGAAELNTLLGQLELEPVFTAHPTEATRRSLLEKDQDIVRALVSRLDPTRTPTEDRRARECIRTAVTASWLTADQSFERPSVMDELEHVMFYFTDVLYRVVPTLYEAVEESLAATFAEPIEVPTLIRFATWVGGDMDGNPNVGAASIRDALAAQSNAAIALYRRELKKLEIKLSMSLTRVAASNALLARLEELARRFPDAFKSLKPRHQDMPYRRLLTVLSHRLAQRDPALDAPALLDDLNLVADSLLEHGGRHAGWTAVRRLIRRVETFGFHLATLDVRQDSRVHGRALAELFGDAGWSERAAEDRCALLERALAAPPAPPPALSVDTEAVLQVFRAIRRGRAQHGARALGPYIVSMARSAADVLAVLVLARFAEPDAAPLALDVAPLLETVEDLARAGAIMRELGASVAYRSHVERRGGRQTVMVGYSDSNKDGGLAAARWALQRAQVELVETTRDVGFKLTIFHGRGGSVSRGGGKTERAVIAAPRGSVQGSLRVTEQGEVIQQKYGFRAIAMRNLEQALAAIARATVRPRPPEPREAFWREQMAVIANASRAHYRELVYDSPGFYDYFRAATPIDVIEQLKIGSRPAARGKRAGIESLRAIPWVFAWSQSRHGLPGWFGMGVGLEAAIVKFGQVAVAEMVRDWPFLSTLIDDVEMVLAKSDLKIAAHYSALASPLHATFFPRLADEFQRTQSLILALRDQQEVLAGDPKLRRSIRLRNPYIDPMSLLQIDLLNRWRARGRPQDDTLRALLSTVHGIAQGLQNTG
jgi:phosphoenolpyruvate carboxylase